MNGESSLEDLNSNLVTLNGLLRIRAKQAPERAAFIFLGAKGEERCRVSYLELERRAEAIARALLSERLAGERALLLYATGIEFISAFFGCLYAGVVPVPSHQPRMNRTNERLQAIAADAQAAAVLTTNDLLLKNDLIGAGAPELRRAKWVSTNDLPRERPIDGEADGTECGHSHAPFPDPAASSQSIPLPRDQRNKLAYLQYTSGSTSTPRGVMVSHGNVLSNCAELSAAWPTTDESVFLTWLPHFHDMGLVYGIIQPIYEGRTCYIMAPAAFLQRPQTWLEAITRYRVTHSGGPNFAYELCARRAASMDRSGLDLSSWSVAFSGAEPVRAQTIDKFTEAFKPYGFCRKAFCPGYGLAEATLKVSSNRKEKEPVYCRIDPSFLERDVIAEVEESDPNGQTLVGCGLPMFDTTVAIVHPETLRRCESGHVGEIWVSGPGVARGYWNRPEETESAFDARLGAYGQQRFLRTGDLGFIKGGDLFITGRLKDLIIIRGRNYYPQDIELTVENSDSSLRAWSGAAFPVDEEGEERLVIIQELERRQKETTEEIIGNIRRAVLYAHEVEPLRIVLVRRGSIPKTTSGKIMRNACRNALVEGRLDVVAEWQSSISTDGVEGVEPVPLGDGQSAEQYLFSLLAARVGLSVTEIDRDQPLILYGLDSLAGIGLLHTIESSLGVRLELGDVLGDLTIRDLVSHICGRLAWTVSGVQREPVEMGGVKSGRASRGQEALWYLYKLSPQSPAYNIVLAARILTALDEHTLRSAVDAVLERHSVLRSRFIEDDDGDLIQKLTDATSKAAFEVIHVDAGDATLSDQLNREAARPFDLERGPLMRVRLFRCGPAPDVLFIAVHHIAVDFWSMALLLHEIGSLCASPDTAAFLPAPSADYDDYVRWQESMLAGPEGERHWNYWKNEFPVEPPALSLPFDRLRPTIQTNRGRLRSFAIDHEIASELKEITRSAHTTLFTTLLTAFQVLLYRYSAQREFAVGVPAAGRNLATTKNVVGYFVNPLAINVRVDPDEEFGELLVLARSKLLSALEHQDFPFSLMVNRLLTERDPSRSPIFQVMFALQKAPSGSEELAMLALGKGRVGADFGGLCLESIGLEKTTAQFDLTLEIAEQGSCEYSGIEAAIEYNTDLFDETTIRRISNHYLNLLRAATVDPSSKIASMTLLSEPELYQLTIEWNDTGRPLHPSNTVKTLLERQVSLAPDSIAAAYGDSQLTYVELNQRSNRLGHYLRRNGVSSGAMVGVCLRRSLELMQAIIGVLKSGGVYVPVDPALPRERKLFIAKDSGLATLLVAPGEATLSESLCLKTIEMDCSSGAILRESSDDPSSVTTLSESAAYVIYTSGSTGQPKGVLATHSALVNHLNWMGYEFPLGSDDRVIQKYSIGFDTSLLEILYPLLSGSELVIAEEEMEQDPASLIHLMREREVTAIDLVPVMLGAMLEAGALNECCALRRITSGGEELKPAVKRRVSNQLPHVELADLYGPTESTIGATYHHCELSSDQARTVPIGRPITNCSVYVLGPALELLPLGAHGELCIGGEGVTLGYLNRTESTAERFTPDPYSQGCGARLYRTGDNGRWGAEGHLEYLGRLDGQVKIRGYRIELGEIESALRAHPAVGEAVVLAREESDGVRRLTAYVTLIQPADVADVRNHLAEIIPHYMLPGAIVVLDHMPLTVSGKIDRRALPTPDGAAYSTSAQRVEPATWEEETLANIWKKALGLDGVGVTDNFFECGGDSIISLRLVALAKAAGLNLTPTEVLKCPTIRGQAALASSRVLAASAAEQQGTKKTGLRDGRDAFKAPLEQSEDEYPLTPTQQGMLFHSVYEKRDADVYVTQLLIGLQGAANTRALERAWQSVTERHEALRAAFRWDGASEPGQIFKSGVCIRIETEDWRQVSADEQSKILERFLAADRQQGFDLTQAPLMRFTLIRTGDECYDFLWTSHHLLMDGWSVPIVLSDVFSLYAAYCHGEDVDDEQTERPRVIQFRNYIEWLGNQDQSNSERFWRRELHGLPADGTPAFGPSPQTRLRQESPVQSNSRGGELNLDYDEVLISFNKDETAQLLGFTRQNHITFGSLLEAAWALLLSRYRGGEEVVFGLTTAGRPALIDGADSIVGLFINTLPLRIRAHHEELLLRWLHQVQDDANRLLAHQHSSLPDVVRWSGLITGSELFDSVLVLENYPVEPSFLERCGDLTVTSIRSIEQTNYPVTLQVTPGAETAVRLSFNTVYLDDLAAKRVLERLRVVLATMTGRRGGKESGAGLHVGEIQTLSEVERHNLIFERNDLAILAPEEASIHDAFRAQARANPDSIALIVEGSALTYRELDRRSAQLANRLRRSGAGPESLIGLLVERSMEMIIAILGVLKAGATYVPLDPAYPTERLEFIAFDAGLTLVVTGQGLEKRLPSSNGCTVILDSDRDGVQRESDEEVVCRTPSDAAAYVIYTSGSTGIPKGVVVTHYNVLRLFGVSRVDFEFSSVDVWSLFHSYAFDFSVWEIWGALLHGGRLVIVPYWSTRSFEAFHDLVVTERVTILNQTPSAFAQFQQIEIAREQQANALRLIVFGGEALDPQNVKSWFERYRETGPRVVNMYGITETTVHVTSHSLNSEDLAARAQSLIGRPLSDLSVSVADDHGQLSPMGAIGELQVGGEGLSLGYLGRADLTAARFVPDGFTETPGARLYRSGDLARYTGSGQIEYVGRSDNQVKIRGFRVEPGEVETALRSHPKVLQCAVTGQVDEPGAKKLAAYIVREDNQSTPTTTELREFLALRLPDHMIPSAFVFLEALPLTANGKLDRRSLPAPDGTRSSEATFIEPQTPLERTLARIWQQVLGADRVSVNDNYFELGGDSIISLRIVARAREAGLEISPKDIFEHPTLSRLASRLEGVFPASLTTHHHYASNAPIPLTPIQRLFFDQELAEQHHYNQAVMLEAGLSKARSPVIEQIFNLLVDHHDALRFRYDFKEGDWEQHCATRQEQEFFHQIDLSSIPEHSRSLEIDRIANAAQASLDLHNGPLMRVVLFELDADGPGCILIVIHHLAVDGVSWRILLEEIEAVSTELSAGVPVRLPAATPFSQWSEALREYANNPDLESELRYWTGERDGSGRRLPIDLADGLNTEGARGMVKVSLSQEDTRRLLREAPAAYSAGINEILLSAAALALAKWIGAGRLLIDLEGHGREEILPGLDTSNTVGWFTTIFPVALDLSSSSSAIDALASVKQQLRRVPNNGIGYGILKYLYGSIASERELLPDAEVSFNYLGQMDLAIKDSALFTFSRMPVGESRSPAGLRSHLLEIDGMVIGGRLEFDWAYGENVHFRETVERVVGWFGDHLRELVEGCLSTSRTRSGTRNIIDGSANDGITPFVAGKPDVERAYPLSPMQQGMLFHTLYDENAGVYCTQIVCRLSGALNDLAFERAWQTLVERDAVLRTAFEWEELVTPIQFVEKNAGLSIFRLDWRGIGKSALEDCLDQYLKEDRAKSFDLRRAPLMKLALIRTALAEHRFIWTFHHLLLDGWSVGILADELFQLYRAFENGIELPSHKRGSYADYISWLGRQDGRAAEAFWRNYLDGFDSPCKLTLEAPSRAGKQDEKYLEQELRLSEELTARLTESARASGVTLNTVVQGMWALLLSSYCSVADVVFGVVVSGRSAPIRGIDSMTGLFINTVPARAQIEYERSLITWLTDYQSQQLECRAYEHTPLLDIQEWSQTAPGQPLFETLYIFENYPLEESLLKSFEGISVSEVRSVEQTNYPFTLTVVPGPALELEISYDGARFDETAISRILRQMESLLSHLGENLSKGVGEIRIVTDSEERMLRQTSHGRQRSVEHTCVLEFFNEQVLRNPDSVSLVFEGEHLTFVKLDQISDLLARRLAACGCRLGSHVGIFLNRSLNFISAVLAVMKSGAACVPLDTETPKQRLSFVVEDSATELILTERNLAPSLDGMTPHIMCLDDLSQSLAADLRLRPSELKDAPAYIMYTSGSTGIPKGVVVPHRALANHLDWFANEFPLDRADRVMHKYSIGFDASWDEVFWPFITGATLMIARQGGQVDVDYLLDLISREQITALDLVPSMMSAFVRSGELDRCRSLRQITAGAEALDRDVLDSARHILPGLQIANTYGPTEAAITCIADELNAPSDTKSVPIGRATYNSQAVVLDPMMRIAPIGCSEEICVGGQGLAWGYLNRAETTAAKFVPNPYGDGPGQRLYRTGDLGRILPDGRLDFVGRTDLQVKLHGFRVELGEIESALRTHDRIREAVVIARQDASKATGLVAYVVPSLGSEFDPSGYRRYLGQTLPAYMIPTAFVELDELPLTASGKIDRKRLPLGSQQADSGPQYLAPVTEAQKRLAEIWAEAIGLERIGLNDNFFVLGGDSIVSIQVVSRARRAGLFITHKQVFEHPTIAELCALMAEGAATADSGSFDRGRGASQDECDRIELVDPETFGQLDARANGIEDVYPLTPAQEGILFHSLYESDSDVYCMQVSCEIEGRFDASAFIKAWQLTIDAHAALRTGFEWEGLPSAVQIVHAEVPLPVSQEDWSALCDEDQSARLDRFLADDRRRGYQLSKAPLMRLALIRLGEDRHQCLWSCHHLILDGWSLSLVLTEVQSNYRSLNQSLRPEARGETPYRRFVEWLAKQDQRRAQRYWTDRLADVNLGSLALMGRLHQDPQSRAINPSENEIDLDERAYLSLRQTAARCSVTVSTILEAAWVLLLSRYSSTDDVVYGRVVSGRPESIPGVEDMVGLFINTVPARTRIPGYRTVAAFVQSLQHAAVEAREFEYSSLADIKTWCCLEKEASLVDSIFVVENYPVNVSVESWLAGSGSGPRLRNLRTIETTNYALAFIAVPASSSIQVRIAYDSGRFELVTVLRMLRSLKCILEEFAANLGRPTGDVQALTTGERHQILVEWNDSRASYPDDALVGEMFERQADRFPNAIALTHHDAQLSYRALDEVANGLVFRFRRAGVAPGEPVALCLDRGIEMIAAMVAVVKAGGAYIPLDPAWPRERLLHLLADAGASAVIGTGETAERIRGFAGTVLDVDEQFGCSSSRPDISGLTRLSASLPLYIVYTSGSTGSAKGVCVPHRAVVRLVMNSNYIELGRDSIMAQASPASFDAATFEIWGPLLNGGRVVVIDKDKMLAGERLSEEMASRHVGAMFITTALFNQIVAESPGTFETLDTLLFGGEKVDEDRVARLIAGPSPRTLLHVYGPTESTTFASWHRVERAGDSVATIPIGRPISNTEIYLLDVELRPVQPGMIGEIYIGGDGLALEYLNRPDLTAERFTPDHFSSAAGHRLYRTGDVARLTSDGAIDFVGRTDRQVKIRGFRIEPAEVEAALKRCPSIWDATVTVRDGGSGERELAAYIVLNGLPGTHLKQVRSELAARLPEYMIPSTFAVLDRIPLNEHGKTNLKALREVEASSAVLEDDDRVSPRTETEEALCWIWSEILGVSQVGVFDDFFELGGHSLLATRIASRARFFFDCDLQVRDVFEYPTVAELSGRVVATRRNRVDAVPPAIERRRPDEFPALSYAQQRLWFMDQIENCGAAYNIPAVFQVSGILNVAALEQSLAEVVRRHEMARTVFPIRDGVPYQLVLPSVIEPIRIVEVSSLQTGNHEAANQVVLSEALRTFDLSSGPLLRVTLLKSSDQETLFLLTLHHIVADGWSVPIFLREIRELYCVFDHGTQSPQDELPIQYADFSSWQRAWLSPDVINAQMSYWRRQLGDGGSSCELPLDRARSAVRSYRGADIGLELSSELSASIRKIGFARRATPFMTFLSSFHALMQSYVGHEDITVGTMIANRNHPEIEPLIGYFANTLVLRTQVREGATFAELLDSVRMTALEAYKHQDTPFETLVDALRIERRVGESPLFQVMFVLNRDSRPAIRFPSLELTVRETETLTAKFDLTVSVEENEGAYALLLEYDTDIFERTTIERMLSHWLNLLTVFAERPDLRLESVSVLSEGERDQIMRWSQPKRLHSAPLCLHQLFAAQALSGPDSVAVALESEQITYAALNSRGNKLANYLCRLGVETGDLVGLCLDRSIDMLLAILGVLKAGAAYVPLDSAHPDERLTYTIEDAGLRLLVTGSALQRRLNRFGTPFVCLDSDSNRILMESDAEPHTAVERRNLAYVIYTSGSTGRPKGVMVSHENISRLLDATDSEFGFGNEDIWTLFHSYAFDFSVWEIWGALARGGRLVIVPYTISREPESFYELLVRERVTILNQTPSAFYQLMTVDEQARKELALRAIVFGGEALELRKLTPWTSARGVDHPQLINMYGITETTVHVTRRKLDVKDFDGNAPSVIGWPIEDLGLYLLGRTGDLAPIGVPAEICVAGAGIALGYLGKAELAAQRFVPDAFSGAIGRRLYRSGDIAKRRYDGDIEYIGRSDGQVKVRGFRIELGEIEAEMLRCNGVREVRVIADVDGGDATRLIAYVVLNPGADVSQIREQLKTRLPDYMLPALIVPVDRMPLTPNGKLDIRSLSRMSVNAAPVTSQPEGGLERAIERIWSDTLGLDGVSIDENFFDLGGNSISMVQVRNKLRQILGIEITMVDMFTFTTIRSLASHIQVDAAPRLGDEIEAEIQSRTASRKKPKRSRKDQRVTI